MTSTRREYLVYADGSCLSNPGGRGGWGIVVRDPDGGVTEFNGHSDSTTNNRMELMAAIEGLRATPPGSIVTLRSDSQYVISTMTDGWKRKANLDLWKLLDAETSARHVDFQWVRGHGTDLVNNMADELAVMGAKGKLVADEGSPERPAPVITARTAKIDDLAAELTSLLDVAESIQECLRCGAKFVSLGEEFYCSHVRCQLKARRTGLTR